MKIRRIPQEGQEPICQDVDQVQEGSGRSKVSRKIEMNWNMSVRLQENIQFAN